MTVDGVKWPEAVDRVLAAPPGPVVFDMDGTLLTGDIGEEVFLRLVRAGHIPPALRELVGPDVISGYRRFQRTGPHEIHYKACCLALAGLSRRDISDIVQNVFMDGLVRPRDVVIRLAQRMRESGHRIWVVTGTNTRVGRAVMGHIGLPFAPVVGMDLAMAHNILTDRIIGPVLYGHGKVEAIRDKIRSLPLFAIGDSPGDLEMLSLATLGAIAVPPREGEMSALCRARGITVCLPHELGEAHRTADAPTSSAFG
jgi:phosphatidylglycerophosphatase C